VLHTLCRCLWEVGMRRGRIETMGAEMIGAFGVAFRVLYEVLRRFVRKRMLGFEVRWSCFA
jgi:hypothetical protein